MPVRLKRKAFCSPIKKEAVKKTQIITGVFIFSFIVAAGCNSGADEKEVSEPSADSLTNKNIVDAYVYLLGRALAVRQEQQDFKEAGLQYNAIKYNEAGKADFVNPNLDVAYMEAWLAIDNNSAVILEIPEIKKRYYTVQLMDGWGEVLFNINERNFPDKPFGKYALCLENTSAAIPSDAYKIVVPNKKLKMLARVELQNTLKEAVSLQQQFKVSTIGKPEIEPVPALPDFSNTALPDISVFEYAREMVKTPDSKMPGADALQALSLKVASYAASSEENKSRVIKIIKEEAIPQTMDYAINKAGKVENNWLAVLVAGEYKGDFWTRTAANFVGIWANSSTEVIYFIASKDSEGENLKGGQEYSLRFEKDKLPILNVDGFWSVILVDFPNYRVVKNELNRYNFNNYSKFVYGKDSSLTLYLSDRYNKKFPKSNWLPSPAGGEFNLTLRTYLPKENVKQGLWFPAPVVKKTN